MTDQFKKPGLLSRKTLFGTSLGVALFFMIVGVIFWGGFNTGMELTNTMDFCLTCHEMEENVYREYQGTAHDGNRSGVRAGCPDCHVPRPWIHKIVRKIQASNEVLHKILGTVSTPEKFDKHRLTMAKRVWRTMKNTDSRECRNCHDFDTMNPEKQKPRARKQHLFAMENGNTCIDCHKGIAHTAVHDQMSDEELEELNKPWPSYKRPVPPTFAAGLQRIAEQEAADELQRKEDAKKAREAKLAAKAAEKQRIEAAVAKALAAYQAQVEAAAGAATAAAPAAAAGGDAAAGYGVEWDAVPSREINLLYPGQASMEWTLRGRDHGGARPFRAGDRCFDCHDKEIDAMGQKIVSGDKAEATPIPGKRGHIPVTVQAAHDGTDLYMRFEWPEGEHTPAPFVDGGKMDPANPMKLALMFATDEVEYAAQSGCWGTCHHDARTMPHTPEAPAHDALDLAKGITKYIKESRTKVEEKGRRGKKLGGWDKLKSADEIAAELSAGHFMDLVRYNSGTGGSEDGYILEQRYMSGDAGTEFRARQEGGNWVVEMKRPLNSGKPGDVAIEAGTLYNFGFAIHDDFTDARFHHVSLGYKIGLDNETAEVNAVKVEVTAGAAPASAPAVAAAPAAAAEPAGGEGFNVEWATASERVVNLLYPGQASMEWVLRGRDHGGARPFKAGDRCFDCHDREIDAMGQKIVTGEKAEDSPIPGKRGHIPVTVNATHDGENLYMRFTWDDAEHTPAPFVDGGKMDPDNPMKLALMFSGDDVEYADRAGCWGTCHHDARTMPHTPEAPAHDALDLANGITKYIKESRTKVEEKGRRGKKLGGWDKLKSAEEIKAELDGGHFMDLLRYKSGSGESEDGYILDQRYVTGGAGADFRARQEAGQWIVEVKRPMKSEAAGDITLDAGTLYNFGFAIHDDYTDARFHHVSLGYKLGFDNDAAEINALRQ